MTKQLKAQAVLKLLDETKELLTKPDYFSPMGITDELAISYIKRQFDINFKNVIAIATGFVAEYECIVLYPASARGDMNAYKYVNCGRDEKNRVFTIIYYVDRPWDTKNLVFNKNMRSFVEHLSSCPFAAPDDHLFLPWKLVELIRNFLETKDISFKTNRLIDYDKFDSWIYIPAVREVAQLAFSKNEVDVSILSLKIPPKEYLVIFNVNGRIAANKPYDPREQRHSSDPAILQAFITAVLKHGNFDVMLTGDSPGELGTLKQEIIDASQLWNLKLDRFAQRSLMYKVSTKYQATLYIGMQSGVNEDAILLHNVNVFSMCENVGSGQVGLDRVTEKMKTFGKKANSKYHNFFVIKNSALLTSTGQLAAIQLKHNPLADYSVNFEIYAKEVKKLEEQLAHLKIDKKQSIPKFGTSLIKPNFDPQSDDEGEESLDDEQVTYLRRDGFPVTREEAQQLKGKVRFKKIDASGLSGRGTQYTKASSGRYLKANQPDFIDKDESTEELLDSIIEVNSPEQIQYRINLATLVIGNLMTITVAAHRLQVSEEKSQRLFSALFDNVTLLNEKLTLSSDLAKFQTEGMTETKHKRRQSKEYRSGFGLSGLALTTEQQYAEYTKQLEDEQRKKDQRKPPSSANRNPNPFDDEEEYGLF